MDEYNLTIIIPTYNEEKTIVSILNKIFSIKELNLPSVQIIVVDDGSTDNTLDLIKHLKQYKNNQITLLKNKENMGKGASIRKALSYAKGEYTIIQDADLEYNPKDIVGLFRVAQKDSQSAVFGSRNLLKGGNKGSFTFYWGGRLITWITNLLFFPKSKLTDEPTCYKLIKTEVLKDMPLTCTGFEFCPQVTGFLLKNNLKIKELPIEYHPRTKQEGKKIKWQDGIKAIKELIFIRFTTNSDLLIAFLISSFSFFIFLFTWGGFFMGYENRTAELAVFFLEGSLQIHKAGFGAILMYIPFVFLGKLFLSGQTLFKFLTLVPIFYSALISGIFYLCIQKINKKRTINILVAVLISVASLIWPYSKIGMEYQSSLLLILLFYTLLKWRVDKTSILYAGFVGFLLIITKTYGIIFALSALLFIIFTLKEQSVDYFKDKIFWLKAILLPVVGVFTYLLINYLSFGKIFGAYSLGTEFDILYWWEGFYGVFFSFGKSIFLYSPLLILSLFYWPKFYKKEKTISVFILSSFILLLLITAPFSYWTDETISVRKLVPVIALLHFPLFLFFEKTKTFFVKLFTVFLIFISIYFQFLNTSYSYWEQLLVARTSGIDTLSTIRYQPQLSHLYIHHNFFKSYIKSFFVDSGDKNFVYKEKSWMRYWPNPEIENKKVFDVNINIESLRQPSTFLCNTISARNRNLFLIVDFFGISFFGLLILCNYKYYKKIENLS